ncbi:MAG: hypothetical protein HeimC2_34010 [Candidatus Heimdallarchaeota archaeon LC_2]|nr:MAG: hypothetical protein HeimC2_34010 [Candidatus Heimdallarchaeota archaeon LC_2]
MVVISPMNPWNSHIIGQINDDEPIVPSTPTDVFIIEEAEYNRERGDERPIVHFRGVVFWEQLGGSLLNFFVNTTDVIENEFWDYDSGKSFDISDSCVDISQTPLVALGQDCVRVIPDRYLVVPGSRSFSYEITAYYDPDIIEDTGFTVIFNSQSVDFSIVVDDDTVFAAVDYKNTITLPVGAGIVSYAPIEKGQPDLNEIITDEGKRFQLTWEYKHRALDSKHDPLIIEVTYSFDDIYLKFTEQVYQNQVENEKRQEEENRLNLLNTSFVVIATLAVIASLFSILLAYLIARKRFESDLQKAKELPRRSVKDIETGDAPRIPTKSLLLAGLILIPSLFAPLAVDAQIENNNIIWHGEYNIQDANNLIETVSISLPVERDVIYIYTNTSEVNSIMVYNDQGIKIPYEEDPDGSRFRVNNPSDTFTYILDRSYTTYNFSGILIYLDRFWVEYFLPSNLQTIEERFFRVDMTYTVLLPKDVFLYSASPTSALDPNIEMTIFETDQGRWNITFYDENRLMDAFHDVFETQITWSYVSILDALENLNTNFQIAKAETQDIDSILRTAASEIFLFSILGLIAPLLSFLIAYWVFKNRYKKKIDDFEKKQEEQIFVEEAHIFALTLATDKTNVKRYREGYIGHYWKLKSEIASILKKDISIFTNSDLIIELSKLNKDLDEGLLVDLLTRGQEMEMMEEEIDYGYLFEYSKDIDEMISSLRK